jgi:hypothetical protein
MDARRERAVFWALLVLLVLGTATAYRLILGREPGVRSPAVGGTGAEPVRLAVARVSGEVILVRGGGRAPLAAGDDLQADDAIETAPGARVELAGGSYEVALEEGGRFDVQEITAELSRFRLASGLVSARVDDGGARAIEIETAPGTVARMRGGDVSVARSGDVVAVGVRRGDAEFRAGGASVVLHAGQQSTSSRGRAPSAPAPLPPSLLLKVTWPEGRVTNQRRIVVTGRTAPGAIVVVGSERVDVRPDGRFTHVVALREGRQKLSARGYGVAGAASSDGPAIVLDTRAPDARFETHDLWVNPRR